MRHPSLRWNRVVRSCGLVVDQKNFLRPLSVSMPRFCRRTWLGYLGGGKKETPGGEGREYTRDKCRCGERQRASSRSNEEDAKGQKHLSLGESLANQLHSGSTHILHSAGGEMTSWRSRERPVAQRRCGPLANEWPLFAESARGDPPVGSWRRAPGAWGRQRKKASHRPASNRDQTCRIHSWPLLHRSCARSHGPLGEGKAYPGYSAGVSCREKHQLPPRGFFPVPSAVSLHLEEAVLSAVANQGCIARTLRVPSSWARFECSMGRPGTLCSPKKRISR